MGASGSSGKIIPEEDLDHAKAFEDVKKTKRVPLGPYILRRYPLEANDEA